MKIINIFIMIIASAILFSCTQEVKENKETKEENTKIAAVSNGDVEVYYFHFTRRCATCNAVESVAKEAIDAFVKANDNKNITFTSVNLDEEESKAVSERLNVSAQALVLSRGEKKLDLTNVGFMYAMENPEKLKSKLNEAFNELIQL